MLGIISPDSAGARAVQKDGGEQRQRPLWPGVMPAAHRTGLQSVLHTTQGSTDIAVTEKQEALVGLGMRRHGQGD